MADLDGVVRIGTEIDDSGFMRGLNNLSRSSERQLSRLENSADDVSRALEDSGEEARQTSRRFNTLESDTSDLGRAFNNAEDSASSFGDFLAAGLIVDGITSIVDGFINAVGESEEFTRTLSRLETSANNVGVNFDDLQQNFKDFVALTNQADSSAEALSNLLQAGFDNVQITQAVEALSGAVTAFPDTLNIESLADSIQETLASGESTGQFGELLDRLGIGAENFNNSLAGINDTAERQQLILDTLSNAGLNDLYKQYAEANSATLEFNEAQAELDMAMSNFVQGTLPMISGGFSDLSDNVLKLSEAYKTGGISGFLNEAQNMASDFVNNIQAQAPQMLESGATFIQNFAQGLSENLPTIIENFAGFYEQFYQNIIENMPMVAGAIAEGLSNIGQYIGQNMPAFLSSALDLLGSFVEAIRQNAGVLVDGALEMAKNLAQGLADSIPTIIEKVPQIITNIAGVINDNAPKLLVTAGEIILTLAKGLIKAIPTLIANIPQIIEAIVSAFMAFNWLNLGKSIIEFLKNGLLAMKNSLASAGQNILNTITNALKNLPETLRTIGSKAVEFVINALKELPTKVIEIGKNIITGLKNGLIEGLGGLTQTVTNIGNSLLNGFKSVFDIHSPSREMLYIGTMLTAGLIQGIKKDTNKVVDAIVSPVQKAQKQIKNAGLAKDFSKILIDAQNKVIEEAKSYDDVGSIIIESLQQGVNDNKENAISSIENLINETIEAMEDGDQKDAARDAGDELMQAYKEALEAGAQNAKDYISSEISKITNEFQSQYDDLISKQQELEQTLGGTYLFEVEDNEVFIEDVQKSIDTLNAYGDAINQLKERGVSTAILDELSRFEPEEGLNVAEKLLSMTDEDFELLNKKWAEKQELAKEIAQAFYKEQMDVLRENFVNEMMDTLYNVPDDVYDIGVDSVQSWIDGMNNKLPELQAKAQELARKAIQAMKDELGIASPSKKGEYIGEMMNAGVAKGLDNSVDVVKNSISSMGFFDTVKSMIPQLQSAVATTMANIMPVPAYAGGVSNNNVTNNQFGSFMNVEKVEIANNEVAKRFWEEAEFYRKTHARAKGDK